VPSICFDSIPFENLINDGENGYVVNDNMELANRIKNLILNPDKLKLMSNNAKKIKDNLSINNVGNIYLEFLFENLKK
jgi:glycosyltransferase involved in cell wall biosynthesis